VLAADKLFATLDKRTRRCQLPNWGPVLLSDTVGFIRDLPHHVIASFKATLEEARQADLLLHVADASNPAVLDQISAVYDVLRELHIEEKDTLLVLNKIDRLESPERLEGVLRRYPAAVSVSAKRRLGIDNLLWAVSDSLSRNFLDLDIETGVDNGRLMAYLAAHGEIMSRRFNDTRVVIHCRLPHKHLGRVTEPGTIVRRHETNGNGAVGVITPAPSSPIPSQP
jgi:GTP-binding protein HflX